MRFRRQRKGDGFTLIEVMIALLLLLIGVAGVLTMQMVSVSATGYSRHATEATILAEDKMEELMTMAPAILADGTDTVDSKGVDDVNGFYDRTWTVQPVGAVNTVTIVVSWNEKGTEPHSISIATQVRP